MDFDKLKVRRGVLNGSQSRMLVLHSTSRPNHPQYNRRVISHGGRITPQSQFVVYNTNAKSSKRQPARNVNRRRLAQAMNLRPVQAVLGQQVTPKAPRRNYRRRNTRRQNNQQKKNITPETLNKDLDHYFQSDPVVASQQLDNQLEEYYRQNSSVENPASISATSVAAVAPVVPAAPVAPAPPVAPAASAPSVSAPAPMAYQAPVNEMDVVA